MTKVGIEQLKSKCSVCMNFPRAVEWVQEECVNTLATRHNLQQTVEWWMDCWFEQWDGQSVKWWLFGWMKLSLYIWADVSCDNLKLGHLQVKTKEVTLRPVLLLRLHLTWNANSRYDCSYSCIRWNQVHFGNQLQPSYINHNYINQCTMALSPCKMGNRDFESDYHHRPHFLAIQLFQTEIFGDCQLRSFTFE